MRWVTREGNLIIVREQSMDAYRVVVLLSGVTPE